MTWTLISVGLIVALLAGYGWLALRVVLPVYRLATHAEQLAQGNFEALDCPCYGIAPIGVLRRSMVAMVSHVRRAQDEHRLFSSRLTRSQEAERARIARELHDDTVQALVAVAQSMEMARNWNQTQPDQADALLEAGRTQALEAVESLRGLIADLRPPALAELGLIPALRMQIEHMAVPGVDLLVEGDERRLDETRELMLFRTAQEALNNAIRHSQAVKIVVRVCYERDGVRLSVEDNGIGFEPPERIFSLTEEAHYGLLGIQERAEQLGGSLRIDSAPGKGTSLVVYIPMHWQAAPSQPVQTVRDPVCSAMIEPQKAYGSVEYKGQRYYFCCPVCQGAFQRDPELYLSES